MISLVIGVVLALTTGGYGHARFVVVLGGAAVLGARLRDRTQAAIFAYETGLIRPSGR
ncbi:hypothetical protein [Streptomyces sp. DT171]|uniref:hypothetical protein n=1 Tax=Streptomyces sp. DT171 TaxID=3416524 RepID=UPI003CF8C9D7